jgi:hypothetical protein
LKYQELKLRLESENTRGIQEYLAAKGPFIRAVSPVAIEAHPAGDVRLWHFSEVPRRPT